MGRVRHSVTVPGPVAEAEALWYDVGRWPSFVDGLAHVDKVDGDWPRPGARVVWTSPPGGRGRVAEAVATHQPRVGQTLEVEDERISGVQSVGFRPAGEDGCEVTLELDYRIKDRNPFSGLVDALFVRRVFADSVRRTLSRFARERRADAELS